MKQIPVEWKLVRKTKYFKLWRDGRESVPNDFGTHTHASYWQQCAKPNCLYVGRTKDQSDDVCGGLRAHLKLVHNIIKI